MVLALGCQWSGSYISITLLPQFLWQLFHNTGAMPITYLWCYFNYSWANHQTRRRCGRNISHLPSPHQTMDTTQTSAKHDANLRNFTMHRNFKSRIKQGGRENTTKSQSQTPSTFLHQSIRYRLHFLANYSTLTRVLMYLTGKLEFRW